MSVTVRGASVVCRILNSTWSPSISKGRNPLPSFSQILRTQAQACPRDCDASCFCVLASTNSPLLHCHCSLHHGPLDISAAFMASSDNRSNHYRLPTKVCPRHFSLTIRTDLKKEKVTGFVKLECVLHLFPVIDNHALARMP